MRKNKDLDRLVDMAPDYDTDTQDVIKSLKLSSIQISTIEAMKRTDGWKILDKKIREELRERIEFLVKDDQKVQTLLALLKVADTKTMGKLLEAEISNILPD